MKVEYWLVDKHSQTVGKKQTRVKRDIFVKHKSSKVELLIDNNQGHAKYSFQTVVEKNGGVPCYKSLITTFKIPNPDVE